MDEKVNAFKLSYNDIYNHLVLKRFIEGDYPHYIFYEDNKQWFYGILCKNTPKFNVYVKFCKNFPIHIYDIEIIKNKPGTIKEILIISK